MDTENTFAKKVQKAMGSAIPDWIPRGKWRGVSYGHILTDEYSCAVTPQVRQTGNRLSGLAGTAYASLFT